jgi:hypothetical protein
MMTDVFVLGAETQAASSLACAYPDFAVTFVSDHDVVDGWNLPNVQMLYATPLERAKFSLPGVNVVPLCPRWVDPNTSLPLSRLFERVECDFPGRMVPVFSRPGGQGKWAVKGDHRHRPDAPLAGTARELDDIADVHGCGLVYQPFCNVSATILAVGHRGAATQLGCVQVFDERFFWDNILQAGETVDTPDVVAASLEILDALEHRGFFTFNWLRTDSGLRLSSLRPVPRAVFRMFRKSGIDLLDSASATRIVPAGLYMIAAPTYVSYQRLSA